MTGRKHIFMTGGTGFFGKSILSMVKRGLLSGYAFTILSRDPALFRRTYPVFADLEQVSFVSGDVRDFVFPEGHFDFVFHGGNPAMEMPPGVEREIILKGTERVLSFAKTCGAEKFFPVSSGAVYGVQPPGLEKLPEDFPCRPVTEYGIAKLEAEKMCLDSGLFTVIPRCFAFTGPYLNRNIHFAIGNFIRDALAGNDIVIKGDGTPLRSYLFADDLVQWLFRLLEYGSNSEAYNVGSDLSISILDLAQTVKKVLNSSSRIRVMQTPLPGVPAARYVPDVGKACSLGCKVRTDLETAIRKSLTDEELKGHPSF